MSWFQGQKGDMLKMIIAIALGGYLAIMLVLLTFFGFVMLIDWSNGVRMWPD